MTEQASYFEIVFGYPAVADDITLEESKFEAMQHKIESMGSTLRNAYLDGINGDYMQELKHIYRELIEKLYYKVGMTDSDRQVFNILSNIPEIVATINIQEFVDHYGESLTQDEYRSYLQQWCDDLTDNEGKGRLFTDTKKKIDRDDARKAWQEVRV